jgi:adenylate/guanylate cyclase family protein
MGADEEGTHERLTAHLGELVNPKIRQHRGRIVKNTGDGFLAEFASVADAVRWAAEIQRGMIDREPEPPEKRRIRFRIGINLGDVIAEEYDIFGDGVNVAARLEPLAEPGGICVSRIVRDRFDFVFEDLGEQQVKNLARPVRVYRVLDRAAAVAELFIVPTQPSGGRVRITAQPLDAVTGTPSLGRSVRRLARRRIRASGRGGMGRRRRHRTGLGSCGDPPLGQPANERSYGLRHVPTCNFG